MILYFAYGSNMDEDDFNKRCQEKGWRAVKFQNRQAVRLNGYRLTFNYRSEYWKAGAANIMESEKDCVYGLLVELEDIDLGTLRKKEGYQEDCSDCSYNEVCVTVERLCDRKVVPYVKTYKVSKSREMRDYQPPMKHYLNDLIIKNAEKYRFPVEYIEHLRSFPTAD